MKILITVGAILIVIGLLLSPRYLVYADPPQKSDIIILFPGPELEARNKEARQLMAEGYAEYLCIPTSFSLYRVTQDKTGLTAIPFPAVNPSIDMSRSRHDNYINVSYFQKIREESRFPHYYENTHVEMLLAKKVIDAYGFRKAIFVSSPYHMKRIKIIAGQVFDSTYDIKMVPSRLETKFETPLPSKSDMRHVFTEVPKMIWLRCYGFWDSLAGVQPYELLNKAG